MIKVQSVKKVTEVMLDNQANKVLVDELLPLEAIKVNRVSKDQEVNQVILVSPAETDHQVTMVFRVSQVNKVLQVSEVHQVLEETAVSEVKKVPSVTSVFQVKTVPMVNQACVAKKLKCTASSTLDTVKKELSHNAVPALISFGMATVYFTLKVTNEPTLKTLEVPVPV